MHSSKPTNDDNFDSCGGDGQARGPRWHVMQQRHHHGLQVESKPQHHKGLWQLGCTLHARSYSQPACFWHRSEVQRSTQPECPPPAKHLKEELESLVGMLLELLLQQYCLAVWVPVMQVGAICA